MIIDPQKIVINRRDMQSRGDGLLSAGLLLAFWGLMLYLAHPLAASTGWPAAGSEAGTGAQSPFLPGLLARYLPIIAGLSLSLIGWAWYNRLRFSGARDKRRGEQPALALSEISANCPFGGREVGLIRQAEVSFFFFDDQGGLMAVKCREASADTDYVLARAAALAPRVAAGLDLAKISETPGRPAAVERTATPAAVRLPAAPLARPLRPVPDGMEGRVVARPRRPVPAGVIGQKFSGGVSPRL